LANIEVLSQLGRNPMFKVALLVWVMLATVLMGVAVVVITTVPSFYAQGMSLIPIACIAAAVVAVPFSFIVASKIMAR
jgi:uncharacterized Tic20 family protein